MSIKKTIVALDQMSLSEINLFLENKDNTIPTIKIGLELFLKYGPNLVHEIHQKFNKEIFLDLKLHDIPKTIEKSIQSLEGLPIKFLTLHLGGGLEMLKAAKESALKFIPNCNLLGVSFLTSLLPEDLYSIYGITQIENSFLKLFTLAHAANIEGVVCSAHELKLLKENFPKLLAITPGIRFAEESDSNLHEDQKRVATPHKAFLDGADYIVMGRPLTKASKIELRERILKLENNTF